MDTTGIGEADRGSNRCGHGFLPSECPYPRCGYREAVAALAAVREAAALVREEILLGHPFGGLVAIERMLAPRAAAADTPPQTRH